MRPSRRKYHHLPDKDVWTWKQDYGGVFESAGMYEKLDSERFLHSESGEEKNITSGNDALLLLQKELDGGGLEEWYNRIITILQTNGTSRSPESYVANTWIPCCDN